MPETEALPQYDEKWEVYRRRYKEAREAGLTLVEAELFADSDQDISTLRRVVAGGCPPDLIRQIVL